MFLRLITRVTTTLCNITYMQHMPWKISSFGLQVLPAHLAASLSACSARSLAHGIRSGGAGLELCIHVDNKYRYNLGLTAGLTAVISMFLVIPMFGL